MADNEPIVANKTTTDISVPETMHITTDPIVDDAVPEDNIPAPTPRENAMAEIYAKRNAQIAKELGEDIDDGDDGAGDDEPAAPIDEPAPAAQAKSARAPKPVAVQQPAVDAPKKTIIVNGEAREVTEEDLIKLAQLGYSSSERYQAAATLHRQAQETLQRVNQNPAPAQQQAPAQQPQQQQRDPSTGRLVDDVTAKSVVEKLNYGTPEEQMEALNEFASTVVRNAQGQNPTIDPAAIMQQATVNALATIEYRNNLEKVGGEFQDVFTDPLLTQAAGALCNSLRNHYAQQGTPKSEIDLYRESLSTVRERYIKPLAPAQADASNPNPAQAAPSNVVKMNNRLERKRVAPQPPTAANAVATDAPSQKQGAITPSQVVAQMKKQRGQSSF